MAQPSHRPQRPPWMNTLFSPPKAASVRNDSGAFLELFADGLMGGGPAITERTVRSVTAVYACVNLIAGAISALPMKLYRRALAGERVELPDDPHAAMLNEEMSPRWTGANGWQFLMLSVLLHGNGYALVRRRGAQVTGLTPVHPDRVEVHVAAGGERLLYTVAPDPDERLTRPAPERQTFDQDDVLHLAGLGFDGVRSPSPLRHQLQAASQVAIATQSYARQFFENGARPDFVIEMDGNPTAEQLARMRERIRENHAGPANQRQPMLLSGGMKFRPVEMSMEDVELLGLRKFQVEEVCRAFGVLPWMIGHEQKMALGGGGAESIGTFFVRFTLRPYLEVITDEINRKLFRSTAKFAQFDTFELERADMKSMFEAFRVAVGRAGEPGFLSVDEVRRYIRYGRMAGGDKLTTGAGEGDNDATQ